MNALDKGTLNVSLVDDLADDHELVLYLMDSPIAFHRAYIPVTGKVTAALMLSWSVQITDEHHTDNGWFSKTSEEWSADIGLSSDELRTARKRLEELELIEVQKQRSDDGFKTTTRYRVNFKRLTELVRAHARAHHRAKNNNTH